MASRDDVLGRFVPDAALRHSEAELDVTKTPSSTRVWK
jgi:hypothetical protein